MVPEGHRLGSLQMREARHHGRGICERLRGERPLIAGERSIECIDGFPDPQAEVGRHLIVARARRVQPAGGRPDQFRQPAFHIHMDILKLSAEAEFAGFYL